MQPYLKYKEYYDRKAKAALLRQNDYCFILQPIAGHQGSKIPFWEYRWTGPYIVENVLPNENYIVRKLNSNKTQILHRIILRKYEPNTVLQVIRPEDILQPDDEIIIPQDNLYVITWETNFGEFPNSTENNTIPTNRDAQDTSNDYVNDDRAPNEILADVDFRSTGPHENDARAPVECFTDVDLTSTGPHENDDFDSLKETRSERTDHRFDDRQSSGGRDTIVPEVLDDQNDDVMVENDSSRGGKYNLRPRPTPNFTDEYKY